MDEVIASGIDWRGRVRRALPQILIGSVIGTAALLLAFRGVEWSAVGDVLLQARGSMLVLALISVAVGISLFVVRWRLLFAPEHRHAGWRAMTGAVLIGQTANIVVPARVGEVARIYLLGRRERLSKVHLAATIVVEKVADLAVFAVSIGLLLIVMTLPEWMSRSGLAFVTSAAVLLVATLVLTFRSDALLRLIEAVARRLRQPWGPRLVRVSETALDGLRSLRDWRSALLVWALSVAILIDSVATIYFVFLAMRLDLPPIAALLLMIVLRIGVAPPSLPGRLGLYQYLIVLALTLFGVDRTVALSTSFALYGVAVVPVLLAGVIWMFAFSWSPTTRNVEA